MGGETLLIVSVLALGCEEHAKEPALSCEAATLGVGSWDQIGIPSPMWQSDPSMSDGTQLLMINGKCASCARTTLDLDSLHWETVSGPSTMGFDLSVDYVATRGYVFGQGGVSWSNDGWTRLDGRALLLDRATGSWSIFSPTASYHLRGRTRLFWADGEFGVWGGYGPVDPSKNAQELALDSNARYLTHFDGLLFDPVTREWRVIPPAREPFEQGKDETAPSVAATWTSDGLFVWGMNPERTGNWGAIFDIETMQWSELGGEGELPPLRVDHKLLTVGDEVFLFGGKTLGGEKSRRLFRYGLGTKTWDEVEVPPWADPIHGAVVDGKLVFLGRCTSGARFDPATGFWDALSSAGGPPSEGVLHSAGSFLTVTDTYYGESETNEVWILDLRE